MDYSSAIEAAAGSGSFHQLRSIFAAFPPAQVNPSLQAGVQMIDDARDAKGYVPYEGVPEPAEMQISMLRSLLPPQVGMLLATVPPGSGILSMADGSYYVFCTESKYVIVESAKTCRSQLMTLPAGRHRLLIAAFGWWDKSKYAAPPYFTEDPVLYTGYEVLVQPGVMTEIVASRGSNFSKMSAQVIYRS